MGKTGRKNKVYNPEFKINVIMDMREHNLELRKKGCILNHKTVLKLMRSLDLRGKQRKAGNTNMPNTNGYSPSITLRRACPEKEIVWITELWKPFLADSR